MKVFAALLAAIESEGMAALVGVASVEGSAPRNEGARMVVRPSRQFSGSIGGGALEWQALGLAAQALAAGRGPARQTHFSLGPQLAQCCGGRVRLLVETFDMRDVDELASLAKAEASGTFVVSARPDPDGRIQRTLRVADVGNDEVAEEVFGEITTPLFLFGAGHVARALVLALAPLPFAIRWIDSRADAFPSHLPANAMAVQSASPAGELASAPDGAFVLVMTHSHPLDLDIVARALLERRFGYVGLIGSLTKRARFESQLRQGGLTPDDVARLVCPIGVAGIEGKEPAMIAAATAAELLIRRGGKDL